MTQHRWDDDERILGDLFDAIREVAPLVETIAEYGERVYAWRTVDQDLLLASLSFDSSLEPVQGRRSDPGDARVLVFSAPPLSLELEVMTDRVVGQIVPPMSAEIQVEVADGAAFQVKADNLGFFDLPGMPGRTIRMRCETAAGRLVTDWVRL